MLYLARMDVTFPESMSPETKADFVAQEKEYSGNLQREGKMVDIWRVVGEYANYSVYDVADHDELHAVLSGFPMYPYMKIKVTPLAKHPNSIK
ncbi:muconolactone Delta-isomerase [Micrococcus terreus]|uniref:Muconolactone Delta-isomerase n=1 Tax=Micrococcus terreus TaxID=574650 RepID=A0A1I7MS82_9MICC|nr:muconolactone Delta-isomerase [Micrococcus terreus]MCT2089879.1 muconolactone Delta-isomerase [Micrococcus terreus]MDK7700831.1 muconolactone Delta-isomerase [Micrococcus terreus]WOO97203.1 muconolactone Delta-isomerase [Micrococcus terreus]SFV24786.1 muconolactone D-isomerase [Micrococcus terreus]